MILKLKPLLINTNITCVLLTLVALGVSAQTIKIGVIEYPPHVIFDKNKIHGPAVDYLRNMFEQHFDNIHFIYLPTKRGIIELNKGSIDLLLPLTKTSEIKNYLAMPMFHAVPGLCFKKADFIPILSSIEKLNGLIVGAPAGVKLPPVLTQSNATIKKIEGSDVLFRGINLLLKARIDSLYHPSPVNLYHYTNPLSKKIACSYFHGYSTGLQVASSPFMDAINKRKLNSIYVSYLKKETYEYYFARQSNDKKYY